MKKIQNATYWSDIVSAFPILYDGIDKPESCDDDKFFSIKNMIIEKKIRNAVREKVLDDIIKEMSLEIKNNFWLYICKNEVIEGSCQHLEENLSTDYSGFELYKDAINTFYNFHQSHTNTIKRLQMLYENNEMNISKHFYKKIKALLHSQLPASYIKIIYNFYKTALRIIMKVAYNFPTKKCTGCFFETNHCKCDYILNILNVTNGQLNTIGFLKSLVVDVIIELMNKVIQTEVELTIKLNFEYQQLFTLEKWLNCKVYNWIKHMFQPQLSQTAIIDNSSLDIIMNKLKHFLFKSFLTTRIQQLYDIILKYPYSMTVIKDLAILLKKIKLEPKLHEIFKNILQSRLLQPLMNTIDILRVYIAAIKVLKSIDPTGLLLKEVTQLIREYLQIRKDTVHCIIIILTVDNHHLINDLKRISFTRLWFINPFLKNEFKINEVEVATLLVGLLESPKLFETEYKVLLANRLISKSLKLNDEIHILNLLKSIFGNSLLHSCEVMIKDVFESAYMDINISSKQSVSDSQYSVRAIIMSDYYWPKFKNNIDIKLPKIIQEYLDFYETRFKNNRKNQILIWNPNLGNINVDILLNNEITHFSVSLMHATVIWHFQEQEEWTIENLSEEINMPIETLRCYITFWINKGLLIKNVSPSCDAYNLINKLPKRLSLDFWQRVNECTVHDSSYKDDGTTESVIVSAQEQRDEELQEFWLYIEKKLKNQHRMSLNEIQKLLKRFFIEETELEINMKSYLEELEILLDSKVKEQRLTFSDGLYTLVE